MDKKNKMVKTPVFRASFPHVFKPHSGFEGQAPKYSITMLFDKSTDITELKKAAFNAAVEKWGPKEKWPKNLRMPFRDGDEKSDLQGYENTIFVTASSKQRPQVINTKRELLTEEDGSFYAGCLAKATLLAYAYDAMGNKGVSFSLQNVLKTGDAEAFSGRKNAEDDFSEDDFKIDSDDASNYDADLGF
jgi:phosphopantothenoylcysteine synthetase/decarboxylase